MSKPTNAKQFIGDLSGGVFAKKVKSKSHLIFLVSVIQHKSKSHTPLLMSSQLQRANVLKTQLQNLQCISILAVT